MGMHDCFDFRANPVDSAVEMPLERCFIPAVELVGLDVDRANVINGKAAALA